MLLCWLVNAPSCRQTPAARVSAPACFIYTATLFMDIGSLLADSAGSKDMTLTVRHNYEGVVTVSVVILFHKGRRSLAGLFLAGKGPAGVVGPVFDRSEHGLRLRVFIGDPVQREGCKHPHLLEGRFWRSRTHGIAFVGLENHWLLLARVDAKTAGSAVAFSETSQFH